MCFTVMATAQESTIKPLLSRSYPGLHVCLLAAMRSEHNNCLRLSTEALKDGVIYVTVDCPAVSWLQAENCY